MSSAKQIVFSYHNASTTFIECYESVLWIRTWTFFLRNESFPLFKYFNFCFIWLNNWRGNTFIRVKTKGFTCLDWINCINFGRLHWKPNLWNYRSKYLLRYFIFIIIGTKQILLSADPHIFLEISLNVS